ncbi:hypothetical protein NM208_g8866 [Fusarium decemcellulare]|uniref:Uncharacterized protein n=1 Tax=Fusarium decemcellulare TaxID=57161 RepID=A0ACC1S3X7_9HYPO|nr:hypothetical protein NM208_g8866 [Fusarium decemcellulare]
MPSSASEASGTMRMAAAAAAKANGLNSIVGGGPACNEGEETKTEIETAMVVCLWLPLDGGFGSLGGVWLRFGQGPGQTRGAGTMEVWGWTGGQAGRRRLAWTFQEWSRVLANDPSTVPLPLIIMRALSCPVECRAEWSLCLKYQAPDQASRRQWNSSITANGKVCVS